MFFKLKWFVSAHLFSRCHYLEEICLYLLALSCAESKGVSPWPGPQGGGHMWGLCGLRTGVLVERTGGGAAGRVFSWPCGPRAVTMRLAVGQLVLCRAGGLCESL